MLKTVCSLDMVIVLHCEIAENVIFFSVVYGSNHTIKCSYFQKQRKAEHICKYLQMCVFSEKINLSIKLP